MVRVDVLSTENGRSLPGPTRPQGRRRLGRYLVFGLLAGVFLARCNDISGDEFLCEEAVLKLRECCGSTTPGVSGLRCYYSASNGGCAPTRPHLSHPTSVCILDHDCGELQKLGTCNSMTWTEQQECAMCRDSHADGGMKQCCSQFKEPTCVPN